MNLQELQLVLDTATISVSILVTLLSLGRRSIDMAQRGGAVVLFPVAAAWVLRFAITGHFPIFGAYESALSLVFFTGITLWLGGRISKQPLLCLYSPIVAGMLIHGSRYSREIWALTISERGFWVHLHAIFAFVAFGLAMCLLSASFLVLLGRNAPMKKITLILVTFYALNIISGSFYRFLLFGTAWSFDPIEAMNLACFLALTTLIHLMSFTRLPAKKAAAWSIVCVVLFVLAYRLILVFPGWSSYHILDIGLRSHIVPK
jgi:ABC-type transport system involved in cytochrome c biogenesis permease subunit